MSDEGVVDVFAEPILADDFIDFLGAISASDSSCQACGNEDFYTINDHENPAYAAIFKLQYGPPRKPYTGTVPTLAVHCAKCGWLRHHAFISVFNWIADNKPSGPDDKKDSSS